MNASIAKPQADSFGISETGEATGIVDLGDQLSPIQVIGTPAIRETMGTSCIQQAIAARMAPGVSQLVRFPARISFRVAELVRFPARISFRVAELVRVPVGAEHNKVLAPASEL